MRELLGASFGSGEPLSAALRIAAEADGGFVLDLALETVNGRETRTLRSQSCEALAQSAAVMIAVVHDPSAGEALAAPPGEPGYLPPIEAPPELVPPAPAWPLAPLAPLARMGGIAGVRVGMGALELPRPYLVIGGVVGLRVDAYRFELGVEGGPGSDAQLDADPSVGGSFSEVIGALGACRAILPWSMQGTPRALQPFSSACLALEAGAIFASGTGVSAPVEATTPWVAPRAELRLAMRLVGPLGFEGLAGLAVPLLPRSFVLERDGAAVEVHRSAPVALRLSLGPALWF